MTSVVKSASNTAMMYDPNGRLVQLGTGATATHFMYDGDALVGEYSDAGALQARYAHGPGVDEPLVWYTSASLGAAGRYYFYANQQGSIVAVTDSNGTTTRTNSYDAYGVPAAGNGGRFQYTGQIWIQPLAMYYYKARIYNQALGRFMQTDPIGYKDDLDLYTYVGNDPLDKTDPSGNCPWCITGGIGAIVGVASYFVATAAVGGTPTFGGAAGAAVAGAAGGLTLNFAASAAAGGTIAGAATALAINTAGGAAAGVAGATVESVVDRGSLPTKSAVAAGAIAGAALQNIAPAAQGIGRVAGVAARVGASGPGVAQGTARAAGRIAEHVAENAVNTGADAVTRSSDAGSSAPAAQTPSMSCQERSACNR